MKNTYVECLDWTWPEKLLYIKSCVGDEIPHNMLCGYAAHSKDEILTEYMHAKYLYCNERGMMSYDDRDLSKPVIARNQRKIELSSLKPKRTRTEYEKVEFNSAWEAVKAFEDGDVFHTHFISDGWVVVDQVQQVIPNWQLGKLYCKVEKEIDWREEVSNFVDDKYSYITIHENGAVDSLLAASSNINFLELCRVALRANGEIE